MKVFLFSKLKVCFAKLGNSDDEIDFGGLEYLLRLNSLDNCFTAASDDLIYSHNCSYHTDITEIYIFSPKNPLSFWLVYLRAG